MDDNKKKQETASATSYLDSEAGLFYSTLSKEDFDDWIEAILVGAAAAEGIDYYEN